MEQNFLDIPSIKRRHDFLTVILVKGSDVQMDV